MDKTLKLSTSININASRAEVWNALTNKELIKEYFFGTDTNTDWKEGSPISFTGTWEGTTYEDKGTILKIEKKNCYNMITGVRFGEMMSELMKEVL